jgi:hypothetical protein
MVQNGFCWSECNYPDSDWSESEENELENGKGKKKIANFIIFLYIKGYLVSV